MTNKHTVSQSREGAQLLCSVFWAQRPPIEAPYKKTHINHPCAIWARKSAANFDWLVENTLAICREYTARYGKTHASQAVVEWCEVNKSQLYFTESELTPFAQVMPEIYQGDNAVEAYRMYYKYGKKNLHNWKINKPEWIE